jgi:hypothetical protein
MIIKKSKVEIEVISDLTDEQKKSILDKKESDKKDELKNKNLEN